MYICKSYLVNYTLQNMEQFQRFTKENKNRKLFVLVNESLQSQDNLMYCKLKGVSKNSVTRFSITLKTRKPPKRVNKGLKINSFTKINLKTKIS